MEHDATARTIDGPDRVSRDGLAAVAILLLTIAFIVVVLIALI